MQSECMFSVHVVSWDASQTALHVRISTSGRLGRTYWSQKGFCDESCPRIELDDLVRWHFKDSSVISRFRKDIKDGYTHEKFHLRDLLIHFLHEFNYKVNKLVLQHLLRMIICDQEGYVISLKNTISAALLGQSLCQRHVFALRLPL